MKYKLLILCIFSISFALEITQQDKEALKKFRPLVERKLYLDYMKSDDFLLRWIKDQSYDIGAARNKLLKALQWRKDNKIDYILSEKENPAIAALQYNTNMTDNIGNPIAVLNIGKWNIRRAALSGSISLVTRHMIKIVEEAITKANERYKSNPNVTQFIILGNFQGLSRNVHLCLQCILTYSQFFVQYENYYPGSARYLIAVNSPRLFGEIANILRPIMSPLTRKIFKIYSLDKTTWDFIDTIIQRDELTREYGGTRDTI